MHAAADMLPIYDHFHLFTLLAGDFTKLCYALNVIWLSIVLVIWKDMNSHIFRQLSSIVTIAGGECEHNLSLNIIFTLSLDNSLLHEWIQI